MHGNWENFMCFRMNTSNNSNVFILLCLCYDVALNFYYLVLFSDLALVFQSDDLFLIILILIFIIIMLSGILILMGVKNQTACIVGSILAITFTIYFIFSIYNIVSSNFGQYINVFAKESLIDDIIPLDVSIRGETSDIKVSNGIYFMLNGGIMGFIGGIITSFKY